MVIAAAGAWRNVTTRPSIRIPCTFVFSTAAAVIMIGDRYRHGGSTDLPRRRYPGCRTARRRIATYYLVNTSLVAGVIAISTGRPFISTWRRDFVWSASSFMATGSAGAFAAVIVARGEHWTAVLLVAPVYLTYRTYQMFVGRLADEKRHKDEVQGLLEREQAARASAEEANRLKDEFLAVVSHELRTPLNAILGWADMLQRGTLQATQRERAYRTIGDSARRQAELIEDLLDVARITTGKLRLEQHVVDLRDVVRDAMQVVKPGADVKAIRVALDIDPSAVFVHVDPRAAPAIASTPASNA